MRSARSGRPAFGVAMGFLAGALAVGLVVPYVRTAPEETALTSTGPASLGDAVADSGPSVGEALEDPTAGGEASATGDGGPLDAGGDGGGAVDPAAGGDGGPTAPAAPAAGRTVGLTDTEIRIGIGLTDVGAAKDFGASFDLGNQRARWEALIEDVNARGGIHGRKIVPDFRTVDAVNAPVETAQAACVAWVEDVKVFAAFFASNLSAAPLVCLTGQGQTLTFTSDGFEEGYYGSGLLFTTYASENRHLRDHVRYLEQKGLLKGKRIGILALEGAERLAVDNTMVPMLQDLGHEVRHIESLPMNTSALQRIPVSVSNFKAVGVDFIIMAGHIVLAGPFAQSAARSNYTPEFAISDFNRQINDQMAQYYPDSFDGTIALSVSRFPEYRAGGAFAPADQRCLDRVHPVDKKVLPPTASAFEVAMYECGIFDLFVAAAEAAGPQLSQEAFVAAAEQLGTIAVPGALDGSIGPGKHHAVDFEREVVWRKSCKCWQLAGGPGTPTRRLE